MRQNTFTIEPELLKKYNQRGPRYTSYPAVPLFTQEFTDSNYLQEIEYANHTENSTNLSLYFHFPFCKTLCYFCACNNVITSNHQYIDNYLCYLRKEIDIISSMIHSQRKVVQLHWGGGTPTYLTISQICDTFLYIRDRFTFANNAEISIEIDPRGVSRKLLQTLSHLGFNRVSFGVQDFSHEVQRAINRIQPETMLREIIAESRDLGFSSINVDLIYGLPHQTLSSFTKTIDKIIDIYPNRMAVFNYAHVPWLKKHQKLISEQDLPDCDEKLAILQMVITRLTDANYSYIGMDHFAQQDDELTKALYDHTLHRNFQGYTTHKKVEIYAMGVTAISQLDNVYVQNVRNIKEYMKILEQKKLPITAGYRLSHDDKLRRRVITEIMCNKRLVKTQIEKEFAIHFDTYFADALVSLQGFIKDGLVDHSVDRIEISNMGQLIIRNIAMLFDRYLPKKQPTYYSRTI